MGGVLQTSLEAKTSVSSALADLDTRSYALPSIDLGPIEKLKLTLPQSHEPYTDKYFLRTNSILKSEELNPYVRAQVFIRSGPGNVFGVDEAIAIIDKYSDFKKNGGKVYAKNDGDKYDSLETILVIEGRVQDIVELETMYLGVIAAETTKFNEQVEYVDTDEVSNRAEQICKAIGDRPLTYFGARHWRYDEDAQIGAAAIKGGASGASTDVGALTSGTLGSGTIPHALENIYAWKFGKENAVREATLAFDRVIDPSVPRIALIDYNNREIDDSLSTAAALGEKLYAVRVDTCGENVAQGAYKTLAEVPADSIIKTVTAQVSEQNLKYWFGNGVTVSGVYALRQALDENGFEKVKIILTSGFGSFNKVTAFLEAEQLLGVKLFDALGVGGLYKPNRASTMDIVAVADRAEDLDSSPMSKVGRPYRPNQTLELRLGN